MMKFSRRDWVSDIATSTTSCILGGLVLATMLPELSFSDAAMHGGIGGFVVGVVQIPLRWMFERRPGGDA